MTSQGYNLDIPAFINVDNDKNQSAFPKTRTVGNKQERL